MYELAVQRSEAPIIFSCRFRHGSNPSVNVTEMRIASSTENLLTTVRWYTKPFFIQKIIEYIFEVVGKVKQQTQSFPMTNGV